MSETNPLSTVQQRVLSDIADGKTVTDAAFEAGVHRNTISNWRRSSPVFQQAWDTAHFDRAMTARDQVVALLPAAVRTIQELLENEKTPAGVRLRAALAVIHQGATPPPVPSQSRIRAQPAQSAQSAQPEETDYYDVVSSFQPSVAEIDAEIALHVEAARRHAEEAAQSREPAQLHNLAQPHNEPPRNPFPGKPAPLPIPPPPAATPPSMPLPSTESRPISPEPISPEPISPEPISPGPISPGPISPAPISPAPITFRQKLDQLLQHFREAPPLDSRPVPVPRSVPPPLTPSGG